MRKFLLIVSIVFGFTLTVWNIPTEVSAQTTIECGDITDSEFTDGDQSHEYAIELEEEMQLIVAVEEYGDYSDLSLNVDIVEPRGRNIESISDSSLILIETEPLPTTGEYSIVVRNYRSGDSGDYRLHVSCVTPDNVVISSSRFANGVVCGNIVESEFLDGGERSFFYIPLNNRDTLILAVEEIGSYSDLSLNVELYLPNGRVIEAQSGGDLVNIETGELPDTGLYMFMIQNYNSGDSGNYSVYIGCNSNGESIQPGDVPYEEADND